MVRQIARTGYGWKAALAVAVAAGALLWHVLACIESPMAFSPSGKDLAFVTQEPYGPAGVPVHLAGVRTYRLMVLSDKKNLRVVEETSENILSAPAYSPDGRQYCYLRIPLPTEEAKALIEEKEQEEKDETVCRKSPRKPELGQELEGEHITFDEDLTLPPILSDLVREKLMDSWGIPAVLVARDAKTHAVLSRSLVELLSGEYDTEFLQMTYLTTRPQYGPDGKEVYLCIGGLLMDVNPSERRERLLAVSPAVAVLSPDGKTLAALYEGAIAFVETDGKRTTYERIPGKASRSGLAWVDFQTLAVFAYDPEPRVLFIKSDGTVIKNIGLELPKDVHIGDRDSGELAIAPNERHMVLAFGEHVFFMKSDGKILKHWQGNSEESPPECFMAQPTFTPDSKYVAFKYIGAEEGKEDEKSYSRVKAIVFFTPEGKEVSRVAVPKAKLPAKKPDEEPKAKMEQDKPENR